MEHSKVAEELTARIAMRPKKRANRYKSKLDQHKTNIIGLHKAGASLEGIRLWLGDRKIEVARSTIKRYIDKWQASKAPKSKQNGSL